MEVDKSIFSKNNSNLFAFRTHNQHVNFFDLFLLSFNGMPNVFVQEKIDCKKAHLLFESKYKTEIVDSFYKKEFQSQKHTIKNQENYYILREKIIVFLFDKDLIYLLFTKKEEQNASIIFDEICKIKKRKNKLLPEINLLINSTNGLNCAPLKITKPKLKIEDNYNKDFIEIHKNIVKRLSKNNDKGIVLLHGKPGTGKTSYIRYLITSLKKQVIFLPPNMAVAITNPELLSLLIENPNSIFVIEDAENIVLDREQNGLSAVSTLLNLSDGLLSDCLNIQIICSFNTDISKIDAALMRKGRLIAKYEFKALEIEKAQKLSDKLGFKTKIEKPTILTDIYNQNETDFKENIKKIGF